MSNHKSHHNHCSHKVPGTIRRVTQAIADRFGFERTWVLIGFIVGLFVNAPLSIIVFLIAWFWTDNPAKMEEVWANLKDPFMHKKPRSPFTSANYSHQPHAQTHPQSHPEGKSEEPFQADPFMNDLKRQFDDLERRTGDMEGHVTSEEYELNQKFKNMDDKK